MLYRSSPANPSIGRNTSAQGLLETVDEQERKQEEEGDMWSCGYCILYKTESPSGRIALVCKPKNTGQF